MCIPAGIYDANSIMKQFKRVLSWFLALTLLLSLVYVAPVAEINAATASSYIATSYAANLSVRTTRAVNLMDGPSSSANAKYTLPADTMLSVKALHKNTSGSYFYEVLYYDMTLYIDATAATMVDHLTGDVTIANVQSPASLAYGQSFVIEGDISSTLNDLGTITAAMRPNTNITRGNVIEASDEINGKSYSLAGSTLDANLRFGSMDPGVYTYVLTVEAISYYIDNSGKLATSAQTVVLNTQQCVITDWTNPNDNLAFGIDVSTWQGYIDWSQVQYDIDFAILRIGYSETLDNQFLAYAEGCEKYNIPYGVYIFSYALTVEEALAEANFVINTLDAYGYDPELPVWYDMEWDTQGALSTSLKEQLLVTFCDRIAEAGYQPGFYGFTRWFSTSFFNSYLSSIPVWIAQIDGFSSNGTATHDGGTWLWQYSWEGSISGISGDVDCNICYFEYPGISSDTSYLKNCTYYPAHAMATTSASVNMRQYPSSSYTLVGSLNAGTALEITGLYKNASGEYWYQAIYNGSTVYVHSDYVTITKPLYNDLAVLDPTMASNLSVGGGYYLNGKVVSEYNTIYTTHAKVYAGEDTLADPVISSKYTNDSKCYNLRRSDVCNNLLFGTLSSGYYTYELSADVRNYYVNNGTLTYDTENVVVWTAPFTVGNAAITPPASVACDHNIVTDAAVAAGCTTTGLTEGSHCSKCGIIFTPQTEVPAAGHSYSVTSDPATCTKYELFHYACTRCGDKYDVSAEVLGQWSETKPLGIPENKIETQIQYRYADCTFSGWVDKGTQVVKYVPTWASGFDTTHSTYTQYSSSNKVSAFETDTNKIVINYDKKVGYLWYHWCDSTKTSSWAYETDPYHTFHVYYDTVDPSNYPCDTFDYSYQTSHSSCSNATYWFPMDVYEQSYTTSEYKEEWTEWTDWSTTPVTASSTRKVETRTVYRYTGATLGNHTWNNGVVTSAPTCSSSGVRTYTCTSCGTTKTETVATGGHNYIGIVTAPTCTTQGYTTYTCSGCGNSYKDNYVRATGHSYSSIVTKPTCTAQGYTTHTCSSCGISYKDAYVAAAGHSWSEGICNVCGAVCDHSTTSNGTCSICGHVIAVPSISPMTVTLSLDGEVHYMVIFTGMNINVPTEDIGLISWTVPQTAGTIENATYVCPGAFHNSAAGLYMVRSHGIPAKMLGDTLYMKIYVKLSDGSYIYSDLLSFSAESYAYEQLRLPDSAENNKVKNLMVSMLNYGAEAQIAFNYKPYDLMNADLTADQQSTQIAYSADLLAPCVPAADSKCVNFVKSPAFNFSFVSVVLEGALALKYFISPKLTPTGNVTMYYWTSARYNAVSTLSPSNASGSIVMTESNGYYIADYSGLAAKQMGETVYIAVIYEVDGIQHTTGVISSSISSYLESTAATANDNQALAKATTIYGYYAKQYFG